MWKKYFPIELHAETNDWIGGEKTKLLTCIVANNREKTSAQTNSKVLHTTIKHWNFRKNLPDVSNVIPRSVADMFAYSMVSYFMSQMR